MSLWLDDEPNLLALAGGRELKTCPWHFTRIAIDPSVSENAARTWIWKNLEGRFCMMNTPDPEHQWHQRKEVAFEEPYEASAFIISQPLMVPSHDDLW